MIRRFSTRRTSSDHGWFVEHSPSVESIVNTLRWAENTPEGWGPEFDVTLQVVGDHGQRPCVAKESRIVAQLRREVLMLRERKEMWRRRAKWAWKELRYADTMRHEWPSDEELAPTPNVAAIGPLVWPPRDGPNQILEPDEGPYRYTVCDGLIVAVEPHPMNGAIVEAPIQPSEDDPA